MSNLHLRFIIPKDPESPTPCVPPFHRATIAPSLGWHAVLWMRSRTSGRRLEEAFGGDILIERFQGGGTAAYESGVDLEDPIEIVNRGEIKVEKTVTRIQSKL